MDPRVSISVAHEEVTRSGYRYVGRTVERRSAMLDGAVVTIRNATVRGNTRSAYDLEKLAVRGEPAHSVITAIHTVDRVIGTNCDSVRGSENAFTPCSPIAAIAPVDYELVFAPIEHIDTVGRIDGDACDVTVAQRLRQLLPALFNLESELIGANQN